MRALVIINRQATTTSQRTLEVLLAALQHDLKVDVAETTHRGHAVELGRLARTDGLDLVIAVGGDGTVNEVVNGLLADDPDSGIPDLAILPGGSTNVFARNLGLPEDPVEATGFLLDAVRRGRRTPIGLGRLDERWFTFCAGVGYDADVIRAVEELRARGQRSTLPLYTRTAIRRFFAQDARKHGQIVLERKGAEPVVAISMAVITNCAPWTYLGGRPLNPTPEASFAAGLDVFALLGLRVFSALRHLAQITLTAGRGPRGRDVVVLHDLPGFVLSAPKPVPVQVDGDYVGERSRMTLLARPSALRVVAELSPSTPNARFAPIL
ncbi:MAG TPA: diacylglycerol kinase family protein [Jiangellaceae bacterium]|nr:diacylglycerol kinase family protein [Jiangellaceae bacterium]